jgi:hypothetical protein
MRAFIDKKTGEQYVEIPTRIPAKMQIYAKTLALAGGKPLRAMFPEAAVRFVRDAPWKGVLNEPGGRLDWRPTKGLTTTLKDSVGQKEATGWMQVNMRFPVDLGKEMERIALQQNVSLSSVCYTMLYWWTWWVYPPASERARRETLLRD